MSTKLFDRDFQLNFCFFSSQKYSIFHSIPLISLHIKSGFEFAVPDCVFEHDLTKSDNTSVSFHSIGWPDGYARNVDCSWIFTAPPGHHLRLTFKEIDLEASPGCINDYVIVYDGRALPGNRDDLPVLNRVCHSNETFVMMVGKTVMTVNFRSDFLQNKTGFLGEVWRREFHFYTTKLFNY